MNIDLARLVSLSLPVLEGFSRIEPREWGIKGILLELGTEIGALGRPLTIWENYRHGRKSKHQLADELSDILFVLINLAQEIRISLSPRLRSSPIQSPEQSFFRLMGLSTELRLAAMGRSPDSAAIKEKIEEMISIVGGLAEHYQIPLEEAHKEEMEFASLWQRLFFNSRGEKITLFVFWRRLWWIVAAQQHQRKLDNLS